MKRILVIGGVVAALVVVVGVVWFQPQKLFIDETVEEAPVAQAPAATDAPDNGASGSFKSLAHATSGKAVLRGETLRLEDFETENGPDLRVILSVKDGDDYDGDFVDLGALKGNKGNQNYEIPADVDLTKYDHAVIWCRRFNVAFGAAKLA